MASWYVSPDYREVAEHRDLYIPDEPPCTDRAPQAAPRSLAADDGARAAHSAPARSVEGGLWQSYYDAGLPWTGEFADAVDAGGVDVS